MSNYRGTFKVSYTAKSPFNRLEAILHELPTDLPVMLKATKKGWEVTLLYPMDCATEEDYKVTFDRLRAKVSDMVRDPVILSQFTRTEPEAPQAPVAAKTVLTVRGMVIGANVDGGPLDGTHLRIEKPSSKYPWRLHLTEGAMSGRKAVWDLPLEGVNKEVAGALLGTPVRITIERDPDAKF